MCIAEDGDFHHGYHLFRPSGRLRRGDRQYRDPAATRRSSTRARTISALIMQKRWLALADHPMVGETRMVGLIGALELTPNKKTRAAWPVETGTVGMIARDYSFANGLVMRATRDTMIIAPPLVISHGEVEELIVCAEKTLDETYAEVKRRGYV